MSTTPTLRDRWRRGQRGWPGSFPLVQLPNAPLLVALGGWLVGALTNGSVHSYARAVFYAALPAWAWEELDGGSHWAVGGVLSELGSTVEAVLSNSRELTVQTDGEGWLTLVPVGDIDELTVTFRTGERVVHRSQVHIREFLPRPPTYYVPI